MARATFSLRSRPVRVAFVVDPNEKSAIQRAIELSCSLSGGIYNPIIPYPVRTPQIWQEDYAGLSPAQVFTRFIETYDVDFIIPIGRARKRNVEVPGVRRIEESAIVDAEAGGQVGIPVRHALKHLYQSRLQFILRNPPRIVVPAIGPIHRLFLSALVGRLPVEFRATLTREVIDVLGGSEIECGIKSGLQLVADPDSLFTRRFTQLYVEMPHVPIWDGVFVHLLNASSQLDVLDYWNLRAAGTFVFPLPVQVRDNAESIHACKEWLALFTRESGPVGLAATGTFIKGRSIVEQDFDDWLVDLGESHGLSCGSQTWIPRISDLRGAESMFEGAANPHFDASRRVEASDVDTQMVFLEPVPPGFLPRTTVGEALFATEVEISSFSDVEPLAEAFPPGEVPSRQAQFFGSPRDVRFSRRGPVFFANLADSGPDLRIPAAEQLFFDWMSDRGWECEPSGAGKIARQMLGQLGGVTGIRRLMNEKLLKYLDELSGKKSVGFKEFLARISEIARAEQFSKDPQRYMRDLVDHDIVRLGIDIQCPICSRRTWFAIDQLKDRLHCGTCLGGFPLPAHSPKDLVWAYRAMGPFALTNRAEGAIGVLLALGFFTRGFDSSTTPALSFNAKKGAFDGEVDLGLFYQKRHDRSSDVRLVLVEAKDGDRRFVAEDARRFESLRAEFGDAILCAATPRFELDKSERDLLKRIVERSRNSRYAGRSQGSVLILTGYELLSYERPPKCWTSIPGVDDSRYKGGLDWPLSHVSDETQVLHLGLPTWPEWVRDRTRKRMQKAK